MNQLHLRGGAAAILIAASLAGDVAAQCQWQDLFAPGADGGERFGWSVALRGDLALVAEGPTTAFVHVYGFDGGAWSLLQTIPTPPQSFTKPRGLAIEPGSRGSTLFVGDPWILSGTTHVGRVRVLEPARDGGWTEAQVISAPNPSPWYFGSALDVDGVWMVVGEPLAHAGTNYGAAHIYHRERSGWVLATTLSIPDGAVGDSFGESVAISGDWIVVGMPGEDDLQIQGGVAHVYRFNGAAWTHAQTLSTGAEWSQWFGGTVDLDGDTLIASSAGGYGHVYELDAPTQTWLADATLGPFAIAPYVSTRVQVDGDRVAVVEHSVAHVLQCDGGAWSPAVDLETGTFVYGTGNANWTAIALDGDTVLGGFAADFTFGANAGAASFFALAAPDSDGDGVSDECDNCGLANASQADCDGDGIGDACAIAMGLVEDCDGNGVADTCDADCNGNGVPDACDIAAATGGDCDRNGVPDECEPDCDGDGVPDACAIATGSVSDCDGNGVPDECAGGVDSVYANDDGSVEFALGYSTTMVWLNPFTVRSGEETITALEVTWGYTDPLTTGNFVLWSDPDGDGDPADAEVIALLENAPLVNEGGWQTQRVEFPPIYVGDAGATFFAGVQLAGTNTAPAGISWNVYPTAPSWFAVTPALSDFGADLELLGDNLGSSTFIVRAIATAGDADGDGVPDTCEPSADIDGDGDVDGADLGALLGAWGAAGGPADLNGDGVVDGADLGLLLAAWAG